MKPKRISIRPANDLEGEGNIVWVYHRKVQVQLFFGYVVPAEDAIDYALATWRHAMEAT